VASDAKPAAPTFTVQEICQPYDVPPTTTTTIDPYTGEKTTITYPGYHVENKTTYIVIKNQPFTSYTNDKGQWVALLYEYSYKGHYASEGNWIGSYPQYFGQADSEYTMIPFKGLSVLPSGGQMDIRVRALIGTLSGRSPIPPESGDRDYYSFDGVAGDYSIITVSSSDLIASASLPSSSVPSAPENSDVSTTPSTPPTSNPPNPQPQTPWTTYLTIIIATACIVTVPLVILAYHYGQKKRKFLSAAS
jgi:hypothetical protein